MAKPLPGAKNCPPRLFLEPSKLFWGLHSLTIFRYLQSLILKDKTLISGIKLDKVWINYTLRKQSRFFSSLSSELSHSVEWFVTWRSSSSLLDWRWEMHFNESSKVWPTKPILNLFFNPPIFWHTFYARHMLSEATKFRRSGFPIWDSSSRQILKLWYQSRIVGKANMWWFTVEVFDLEANIE